MCTWISERPGELFLKASHLEGDSWHSETKKSLLLLPQFATGRGNGRLCFLVTFSSIWPREYTFQNGSVYDTYFSDTIIALVLL